MPGERGKSRKHRKRFARAIEKAIYEKHNRSCAICGRPTDFDDGVLDHIIPLGREGPDTAENLQWTCYRCNILKGDLRTNEDVRSILGLPADLGELKILQDREKMIVEPREPFEAQDLPILSQDGLDSSGIARCVQNLYESYLDETIIPEIFRTRTHEKWLPNFGFIGFNFRLPRKWFLPDQQFSNEFMFRQFGRSIALGEQRYLQSQILNIKEISSFKGDFAPETILRSVEKMRDLGFEPSVVITPIKYFTKMYRWKEEARVEYSTLTPRPRIDASLVIDGLNLKIVPSIGSMPLKDIALLSAKTIRWHVKRNPEHGALFIAVGNDRLYRTKYVEVIAGTIADCEIQSKGISILRIKEELKNKQ